MPLFDCIKKEMITYLPTLQLKKYIKNEYIYKIHEKPEYLYLIVKGSVTFEAKVPLANSRRSSVSGNTSNRKHSFNERNFMTSANLTSRKGSLNQNIAGSPTNRNSFFSESVNVNT